MTFCDAVPEEVLAQHAARKVAAENAFTLAKAAVSAANPASAVTAASFGLATAATAATASGAATADATAGEWDLVHALVAEKLAPVVENAVAAAAANSAGDRTGDRAGDAGNVGGRSSTRLAQKKATQGGRVAKELNPRSKGVVNKFIRDWVAVHPDDGIFRKKQYWQIRRQCWGTFLDHVCSRAVLSVDENSFINLQKKAAPAAAAARAPLVVPSSTIRSPTPPAAGPSAAGPSAAGQADAGPSSA